MISWGGFWGGLGQMIEKPCNLTQYERIYITARYIISYRRNDRVNYLLN